MTRPAAPDPEGGHLSDYERAICYFTLPRVTNPLEFGLVVAYGVVWLEAVLALAYGVVSGDSTWQFAGAIATIAATVFGVILFSIRAFVNEIRERRLLAAARGVPDAAPDDELRGIPDPFARHVLLRHARAQRGRVFVCADGAERVEYVVEHAPGKDWWKVVRTDQTEVCRVHAEAGPLSFALTSPTPSRLTVHADTSVVAQLLRRMALPAPYMEITCAPPSGPVYTIRRRGVYVRTAAAGGPAPDRLVGRMYYVRDSFYLDIERAHLNLGVLAYFIAIT